MTPPTRPSIQPERERRLEVHAMPEWSRDERNRIGGAEELRVASRRPDGALRPYVTIWTVRAGRGRKRTG